MKKGGYIANPGCGGRKALGQITDRAKRYRSNQPGCKPNGPKICCFCGSKQNVEVHHVDGHEEHIEPGNLAWACRPCNVVVANTMRQAGLGRKTVQYNPRAGNPRAGNPRSGASSLGAWVSAVRILRGDIAGDVGAARDLVRSTSPARRAEFARQIWDIRRERHGPTGRQDSLPF